MDNNYLTVTALTKYIKYRFDSDDNLKKVFLKGEISNFKKHSRGHFYFTIKDSDSQISAVMFASSANKLLFTPSSGMKIFVEGKISLYEATGNYQIYVTKIVEDGLGSLHLAYEQLKKDLIKEGFFDESNKKSIPVFPKIIGVITSPTGAVIKDIINTVKRRYPLTKILLYPALVQGTDAKDTIVECIKKANKDGKCDVLIVGRGGGSIEDLWPFNERIVAEAIYKSVIPIISAVGHETDYTIADYVADKRAPTPSAAAEIATPSVDNIYINLKEIKKRLYNLLNDYIEEKKKTLVHLDQLLEYNGPFKKVLKYKEAYNKAIYQLKLQYSNLIDIKKIKFYNSYDRFNEMNIKKIVNLKKDYISNIMYKINKEYQKIYYKKQSNFEITIAKLSNLNPLVILKRGYSVVSCKDKVIKSISEVKSGDDIKISVSDGSINAIVKGE